MKKKKVIFLISSLSDFVDLLKKDHEFVCMYESKSILLIKKAWKCFGSKML